MEDQHGLPLVCHNPTDIYLLALPPCNDAVDSIGALGRSIGHRNVAEREVVTAMRTQSWRESGISRSSEHVMRAKYASFRGLLSVHNECLEILAGVQEDLQYTTASQEVLGNRVSAVFDKMECGVSALEELTGKKHAQLAEKVRSLRRKVETEIAARDESASVPVARWLSEVNRTQEQEVGSKAAALGEIRNKMILPVPDGFVLTATAYHQFCSARIWKQIRDAKRNLDLNDLGRIEQISAELMSLVRSCVIPRSLEVAIVERARALISNGARLAVRSSAVGEGGTRTYAGQFVSILNVPQEMVLDAYREVVAGRFSAKALSYHLSASLPEVKSPMAVLCMRMVPIRASGIMYTRNPNDPKSDQLWITTNQGMGRDLVGGAVGDELFVMSRKAPYLLREQTVVRDTQRMAQQEDDVLRSTSFGEEEPAQSLSRENLCRLTEWGVRIEEHFGRPQDIEWAEDEHNHLWIVQSRQLALARDRIPNIRSQSRAAPILLGGRTIHPGRVSGTAHLVQDMKSLTAAPPGAIVFVRHASTEIVEILPRISGLVADSGSVTSHAATLLREFAIPSVFQLSGAFNIIQEGEQVSLDSVQPRVYRGRFWSQRGPDTSRRERYHEETDDLMSRSLLRLNLIDPAALNFRPAGCNSAHDVLRYCHEKAIQAMFMFNDRETEIGVSTKRLRTPVPVDIYVLDLRNGNTFNPISKEVEPSEIASRPFQALWRGVTHPDVTWTRDMAAGLGDMVSVMMGSITSPVEPTRALGEHSYLLVADEYMNLNSRLAYHYTLIDACVSDISGNNYIAFRFAGGGSNWERRNLRASFIEICLLHYGFHVDRRGDLVYAWFKRMPAEDTESHLDILGRLMACSSQLDMYMADTFSPKSFAHAFREGNYSLQTTHPRTSRAEGIRP